VREALTVIGFLLILAFAALFTAPLYVDWNSWRGDIAARLSQHFGTPVIIKGPIEARILPQPWLSMGDVSIGDPYGKTSLRVGAIDGDVSLGGLLRGDIDLSNVVVRSPQLTIAIGDDGLLEPLAKGSVSADASVESFEVEDGTLHYLNPGAGQDVTLNGIHLVGESGSLYGPYKAEGGVQLEGVPHTVKLITGVAQGGSLHLKISAVPADRPLTVDLEGEVKVAGGQPTFAGMATLARPAIGARAGSDSGNGDLSDTPWSVSGPVTISSDALVSDKVVVQIGPDERALKLGGSLQMPLGPGGTLDTVLSGSQLELDRFSGVSPDARQPPAAVLARVVNTMPGLAGLPAVAHIDLSADGVMLGGELMQNIRAELSVENGQWRVGRFESDLPGQSHLLLAGDVNDDASGFKGNLSLRSDRATGLLGWLQGAPVLGAPAAARKLSLAADLIADGQSISLSKLALAIGDAKVNGQLAWRRLAPNRAAGRVEADLAAQRIDLDTLPSMAALLPGRSDIFSEADIKLAAQSLAFSGIEAKSVSGRVKAGGKLIALEDVVVNDLGGASLTANGRIDNIGAQPQGEIRVVLNGRDLTGLATALKRSSLSPYWVNAFAARAAALSPANASMAIAFGTSRQYSVDGKFGGSVAQFDAEFAGAGDEETADIALKADSLDVVTLLRQVGLEPATARIPGRASLRMELSGPLNGARRWNGDFDGAEVSVSGNGKMTGPFEAPSFDGRLKANTDDALLPAQLFGVALPGVMSAQSATIDSGFHIQAGHLVFDDVSGTWLGMPVDGALSVTAGRPVRVDGRLGFLRADAELLGSLLSGADLGGPNDKGNAWADEAFGRSTVDNLTGSLTVTANSLRLSRRFPELREAKANVAFGSGKVSVDDFSASLAQGSVTGALELSRAALDTAATGHFVLKDVVLDTQDIAGTLDTSLDFQGTGRSPDDLMSSLTGGGTLDLRNPVLAGFSDSAFDEMIKAVDDGLAPDAAHIKPAFEQALALKPLGASAITGNLTLAGGVLRLPSTLSQATNAGLALSGLMDLSDLTTKANIVLTPADPKDGIGGPAPTIPVLISGALDGLHREVDVSGLTAWLSIRTAEQQARKLEILEAKRQAEDKAQEDARRAEAEQMQKAIDDARRKALLGAGNPPGGNVQPARPPMDHPPMAPIAPRPSILGTPPVKAPSSTELPGVIQTPTTAPLLPPTVPVAPDASSFQKSPTLVPLPQNPAQP